MTPETTTAPTEIAVIVLPAELPEQSKIEPSMLTTIQTGFAESFRQAEELRIKAQSIVVRDHTDFAAMKEARALRLELRTIRTTADKTRKGLKESALLYGRALDGTYNLLELAIKPLETYLQEQEDTAALYIEREKARVLKERMDAISPFLRPGAPLPDLAVLDDDQWKTFLDDARILHEAREEQARKDAAAALAAEQAAAAEKERLRFENERLQREAAEAAEERAKVAAKVKAELEAAQAEINAEKAKAAAATAAAEAAAKAAAESEARRVAAEAKAKADAEAAEAAREAAAAKAKADEEKAAAAAKRKADRAPDKAKLEEFIKLLKGIVPPTMKTEDGKEALDSFNSIFARTLRHLAEDTAKL